MSKSNEHYQSLNSIQVKAIQSMFRFYDLDLTGKITKERAQKILQRIGVDSTAPTMHHVINLKELLEYIDHHLPDPDPPLQSELVSFVKLVSRTDDANSLDKKDDASIGGKPAADTPVVNPYALSIKPQNIVDFFESTDQPLPGNPGVIHHLVQMMTDWDDCSETPSITPGTFNKDLTKFAKKTNALRDFS